MSADEQIKVMDAKGIDKAIILPLNNAELSYEVQSPGEVLEICQKYPGRFIPFCNLDPRLKRVVRETQVDDFVFFLNQFKELGFKGLGEMTVRLYWDDPSVVKLLRACAEVEFPITFHSTTEDNNDYGLLDEEGLPYLEKVLQMIPDLKILAHGVMFWTHISSEPGIAGKKDYSSCGTGKIKSAGRVVELLEKYPNLYGDISAGSGYKAITRDPEFSYDFIRKFEDKLVFGMDYCSPNNDMRHLEWLRESKESGCITDQAFEKITYRNINKIASIEL
jgi:hypothetical protein